MKKHNLPFDNVRDLHNAYELILGIFRMNKEPKTKFLAEHGIPFTEIDPVGLIVDFTNIPKEIADAYIKLCDGDNFLLKIAYQKLGVTSNENPEKPYPTFNEVVVKTTETDSVALPLKEDLDDAIAYAKEVYPATGDEAPDMAQWIGEQREPLILGFLNGRNKKVS